MRPLRDHVLTLRALGVALLTGLLGLAGFLWRRSLEGGGSYSSSEHDLANGLMQGAWWVAAAASLYVAIALMVTPRGAVSLPRKH